MSARLHCKDSKILLSERFPGGREFAQNVVDLSLGTDLIFFYIEENFLAELPAGCDSVMLGQAGQISPPGHAEMQ